MLSIPHLIIIFVVALVVFGPEKLPELARNLGKVLGEFRRATGELRNTFEGHLQDLEREAGQRQVGGGTPAAAPAASPAAPEGVVATTPPNNPALAAEQPQPENLYPAHHESMQGEASHSEPSQPETIPENVSDGGTRPA